MTDELLVRVTKITLRIVVPELTVYLSVFDLFLSSELWPYYQKDVNQTTLNHKILQNLALEIFEVCFRILLNANPSLNQTFLTILLYVRQTWMNQLVLAIFFEGLSSFNPKGFCYSYASLKVGEASEKT